MTLLEDLRTYADCGRCKEAANEIEQLEAEIDRLEERVLDDKNEIERLRADYEELRKISSALHHDNDRLRAALRSIIIRCEEGDRRTNWLPTIASIANAALDINSDVAD